MGRVLIPYYRDIRNSHRKVEPSVEKQRKWVETRAAAHPFAELVDLNVFETEDGYERPGTTVKKSRPILKRVMAEAAKYPGESVILLPNMGTRYNYPWIKATIEAGIELKLESGEKEVVPLLWWMINPVAKPGVIRRRMDHDFQPGEIRPVEKVFQDVDLLWDRIERDCSYFLRAVRSARRRLLFRGIDKDYGPAFMGMPREDRIPQGSENDIHEYAVGWAGRHGLAARNNSLMCSTSPSIARSFMTNPKNRQKIGRLYVIFPCDGFSFAWAQNARDFYAACDNPKDDMYDRVVGYDYTSVAAPSTWLHDQTWNASLEERLWLADYTNTDLAGAFDQDTEVMIAGAPYYAFDWLTFREAILLDKLRFRLRNEMLRPKCRAKV